eukprot:468210_1
MTSTHQFQIPLKINHIVLVHSFINNFKKCNKLSRNFSQDVVKLIIQFYYLQDACIVIDNGSGFIKAGFDGHDIPWSIFPSFTGRAHHPFHKMGLVTRFNSVGDERIYSYPQIFSWKRPVQNGIIKDFDSMKCIWNYMFNHQLRVDSEQNSVLLTEAPLNPRANREKITEIMFDTFNVKSLYIAVGEVLALYASGRTTGIVLSSGDKTTNVVPIYEGHYMHHAVERSTLAGDSCTDYLLELLQSRKVAGFTGYNHNVIGKKIARDIKETLCYVTEEYEMDIPTENTARNYVLPDGQVITINSERYQTPEILFGPYMMGFMWSKHKGIHEMLYDSIQKCDNFIKNDLYENIVLCGGSTLFEGFPERVQKELKRLTDSSVTFSIIAPVERQFLQWIGGSILSSLSTFQGLLITREEYNECGPAIVHQKCR